MLDFIKDNRIRSVIYLIVGIALILLTIAISFSIPVNPETKLSYFPLLETLKWMGKVIGILSMLAVPLVTAIYLLKKVNFRKRYN